jgi:tRNA modification GTPase
VSAALRVRELSAPGRGAVSVLALAGSGAAALLERLCGARLPPPGGLALVHLCEGGVELDEALLATHGPGRYELQVHGSPPLVRRLLALCAAPTPAERPRNAEARALEALARARGEAPARMLLDQAEGALRRELAGLEHEPALRRRRALADLAERARVARRLVEPACVVIAGPANAGKSTLFNVLLGEGRALVHEQPGTTRDALREQAFLGAYPVWLCDTAGERPLAPGERGAELEAEGQRRARRLVQAAELVLWLDPAGAPPAANCRRLASRSNRAQLAAPDRLAPLEEPEHARARIAGIFRDALGLPELPWTPGVGVPFDAALAGGLARLDPALEPAAWKRAIEALLGPPAEGADCLCGPDALPCMERAT